MQVKIFKLLKEREGYISGEDIGGKLSLSRAAIWKHIQELRDLGYEIVAVPHLGYKLIKSPDRLYPWEVNSALKTKFMGRNYFYKEVISSTMDWAWDLGKSGIEEGAVFLCEHQAKGRGRLGRAWVSPKFKGLYFSLVLRPDITPQKISCITLLSAVSIAAALKKTTGAPISIKWPNDILIEDAKLAGILTEINAEQDRINFVVVGIGINVNNARAELPAHGVSLYSYLHKKFDRLSILASVLEEFEKAYVDFKLNGPDKVISQWRKASYIWGSKLKVLSANKEIEGEAVDLDADGALLLRRDSGIVERIIAGDIVKTG